MKPLSEMSLQELWELFPVILKDYNPAYKDWYAEEKASLENAIGTQHIKRLNHIGSSSVEGLIAKPTVDILLEIDKDYEIAQLTNLLNDAGWLLMSSEFEPDMKLSFNKGYTPNGFADKVFHLHVRYFGDWNELYFRDYLSDHKLIADEYGELKKHLLKEFEHDRDGYTNAKSDFIIRYSEIAKQLYNKRYAGN
jgi:GrpB-like predicted nucleotidyltransferase (UPF0157 family)